MNLLDNAMEPCIKMEKTEIEDAGGGFTTGWTDALAFKAFVRKESAPEITIAERQGVKEVFTVVVPTGIVLEYNDVFRRVGDGAIFRMTSNTKDGQTLRESSVPIAKATCERWVLT